MCVVNSVSGFDSKPRLDEDPADPLYDTATDPPRRESQPKAQPPTSPPPRLHTAPASRQAPPRPSYTPLIYETYSPVRDELSYRPVRDEPSYCPVRDELSYSPVLYETVTMEVVDLPDEVLEVDQGHTQGLER